MTSGSNRLFLIVFFLDHNELPNLEFQRALNRGMNGSVLYAFFVDGDINNSAKVLEFILTQKQISQGKFILTLLS